MEIPPVIIGVNIKLGDQCEGQKRAGGVLRNLSEKTRLRRRGKRKSSLNITKRLDKERQIAAQRYRVLSSIGDLNRRYKTHCPLTPLQGIRGHRKD